MTKLYKKIIGIFGDVKYFKYPLFLVYDPSNYLFNSKDYENFLKNVQTGDIILRTYTHYLNGAIIPGFYSHAGLYIGNNEIFHATGKSSVSIIGAFDFVKCDGVAIVRPLVDEEDIKQAIAYAMLQIGKKYDFWFNFDCEETYCCTELIYWAFKNSIDITPITYSKLFGLIKQTVVAPDDFIDNVDCELVFESTHGIKNRKKI